MVGGGAGQGARGTGTAATPAAHPRAYKQNALGKLFAKESWEGSFLFSHPGLILSFQETVARLFSPAASFPPPGPRARSWALKPGLEGRRKRQPPQAQPSAGRAEAAPPPAPRAGCRALAGRSGASPQTGSLTLPHIPAQSPGARRHLRWTATQKWR